MLFIAKEGIGVANVDPGAVTGSSAGRKWRVVAAGFAALMSAIALAGCGPLPTVQVESSGVAFEGGSCDIAVKAANLSANTTYGIGLYTTGSPAELGTLTSNSSGSVFGVLDYPSDAVPRVYSNLYVEVYGVKSSGQFGWGLGSAKVTLAVCLPTGLAP
jgi:hypothetical protein